MFGWPWRESLFLCVSRKETLGPIYPDGYRPCSPCTCQTRPQNQGSQDLLRLPTPHGHLSSCFCELFLRILAIKASAIPSASYTDNGSAFLHIVPMSGPHKAHVYQVIPLYTSKNSYAHFKLPSWPPDIFNVETFNTRQLAHFMDFANTGCEDCLSVWQANNRISF